MQTITESYRQLMLLNQNLGDTENAQKMESIYNFLYNYLVSEGASGEYDSNSTILTFKLPKKDFRYSFKDVLKELPPIYDETIDRNVRLFSNFGISIPVYSMYDCTGQLCGYSRSTTIVDKEYYWYVIVETFYSYDY